jgi:glycosyltransferase involved in cell wall biosynthesis
MKIMIAAVAFSSEMSGVQRHAFNLANCLLLREEFTAIHLVVAPWQRALVASEGIFPSERLIIHVAPMEPTSVGRNLWYYRRLPLLAAAEKVDLVHLSYPVPVNHSAFPCPVVSTLHDLYPYEIPRNFSLKQILFNRFILGQCLRSVDAIVCVSQTTHDRLRDYVPQRISKKAIRIYNSAVPMREISTHSPIPSWQGEPFLLCVAQHRRNKNIPLLVRSFANLLRARRIEATMRLIVVGISGPDTPRIRRLIDRFNLRGRVHLLEGLAEPELKWCYSRCEAVAVPSSTEGFGMPVAEALLNGSRIICSDIPAFREIDTEHCRFVELGGDDEQNLADAIAASLREPARNPVPLPQFTLQIMGGHYVPFYRGLIAPQSVVEKASHASPVETASAERGLQWK